MHAKLSIAASLQCKALFFAEQLKWVVFASHLQNKMVKWVVDVNGLLMHSLLDWRLRERGSRLPTAYKHRPCQVSRPKYSIAALEKKYQQESMLTAILKVNVAIDTN